MLFVHQPPYGTAAAITYLAGQIQIAGGAGGTLITGPPLAAMTDPNPTGLTAPHHA